MTWSYTGGTYATQLGEYALKVRVDPAMPIPTEDGDLGSDEHPFVWRYEVVADDGVVDFRGVRETLSEAQNAAWLSASQVLPDELEHAEGF